MLTTALLQADNISRQAGNGSWLLKDVSLDIATGDQWGIAGATGSGKTLLLRALSLLDPIDEGCILWKGKEISNPDVPTFRRRVIYLHQRPVLFEGTVQTNLRLIESIRPGSASSFDRERVLEILSILGRSDDFLAKSSNDLSGGEAQIVALMRVVLLDPVVLLLDEPTAALDGGTTARVEQCLRDWLDEQPTARAQCWITHDISQADRVATRILHMAGGRLVSDKRQ